MLVFAPYVKGKRSGNSVCRSACDYVHALPIRATIVVDNRLAKVKSIVQRCTRNSNGSLVYRVQADTNIPCAFESGSFFLEFFCERLMNSGHLAFIPSVTKSLRPFF